MGTRSLRRHRVRICRNIMVLLKECVWRTITEAAISDLEERAAHFAFGGTFSCNNSPHASFGCFTMSIHYKDLV